MSLNQQISEAITDADGEESGSRDFGDLFGLHEDWVSNIISFTSPLDACILACVSKSFSLAARSDVVWDKFLPADCLSLLPPSLSWSSKRELYFALCQNHVLIEDGRKSFWLEKHSGNKCYMLSARDLAIGWRDASHWNWISHPESRFPETAELIDGCFFEIRGKMNTKLLSPETMYSAFLVYKLTDQSYGFEGCHLEAGIEVIGKETHEKNVWLDTTQSSQIGIFNWWRGPSMAIEYPDVDVEGQCPEARRDGWMEIDLGEFFKNGVGDEEVEMSVMESKSRHWKKGIIVQGIEIRPIGYN